MAYFTKTTRPPKWCVKYKSATVKERTVKASEWGALGFISGMSREDADRLCEELTKSDRGRVLENKRNKILSRLAEEDAIECSRLPPLACQAFQDEVILKRLSGNDKRRLAKNKLTENWRTCKRLIRKIESPPENWADDAILFYNEFEAMAVSQSYVGKLIRMLNQWGFYISKRNRQPFEPIAKPDRGQNRRLLKAFRERGRSKKSKPLSPELLETHRAAFKQSEYRWLFISIWLGLRPEEIDILRYEAFFDPKQNVDVLRVFMPKIVTEDENDSWKLIPLLYFEQKACAEYMKAGDLERPSLAKLHAAFGKGTGVYGGRKGFQDLMKLKGHDDLVIADWMGHLDVKTTRRSYRNKMRVSL